MSGHQKAEEDSGIAYVLFALEEARRFMRNAVLPPSLRQLFEVHYELAMSGHLPMELRKEHAVRALRVYFSACFMRGH